MLPRLRGAYCLVFMDERTLYAARDPHGVRPLVLGRLERGWVVASETAALDIVGASVVREIEPGELVVIDADGLRSTRFAEPTPTGCVFEYVYLARPDTTIAGTSVHAARVEMGRVLAREHPVEADLVIPVPESGTPAAIGYAAESGIRYAQGLTKNAYVGRTFIQPSQTLRQLGIRLKLNPLREVIHGQRLVVVDDSIVRGNTQRALVRMLREAGAAEVHVRISSPPVRWPCFYGIDFATRAELIATGLNAEEVGRSIGADSLGYISLAGDGLGDRPALGPAVHRVLHGRLPDRAAAGRADRRHPDGSAPARRRRARDPGRRRRRLDGAGAAVSATGPTPAITYASAGVDTEAGDRAVELMKDAVRATHGPQVLGGVGGFAGLYDASALTAFRRPLLATSTDGVGTKVAIAQAMDVHDTIGFDLVGMVVDDIVVVGAQPLVMTDYIACGRVVPERIAAIVRGIAAACAETGTALVGGETAEHPGLLGPDEYDVAGAATGVVEADDLLGPDRVREGDVVLAMASSGLHSNGYSLVRRVIEVAGWELDRDVPELGGTLGAELLTPTRLYTRPCLDLARTPGAGVHAFSHVTGGGLAANLARVLPESLVATVERGSWQVPPIFDLVRRLGQVAWSDLEATLNLGVGMVAVVAADGADAALARLARSGVPAWVLGEVGSDDGAGDVVRGTKGVHGGGVRLCGTYRV